MISKGKGRIGLPLPALKDEGIRTVLDFVYNHLEKWKDDPIRPAKISEEDLNNQLCRFLNVKANEAECLFFFHHEAPQGMKRKIDISAVFYSSYYDDRVVFEAKRLPAPSKKREREYVTGASKISGGIQRFKTGAHGRAHDVAAIIGYIQKEDALSFYKKINLWISEESTKPKTPLMWKAEECLTDFCCDTKHTARSISTHCREGQCPILLHHFWILMSP